MLNLRKIDAIIGINNCNIGRNSKRINKVFGKKNIYFYFQRRVKWCSFTKNQCFIYMKRCIVAMWFSALKYVTLTLPRNIFMAINYILSNFREYFSLHSLNEMIFLVINGKTHLTRFFAANDSYCSINLKSFKHRRVCNVQNKVVDNFAVIVEVTSIV